MAARLDTGDILQRSQTLVNQAVDRGTSILADRVEHYINVAREVGGVLRERQEEQAAAVVEGLADQASGLARYLRNNDGQRLWSDAQGYARDKTWLLAGIGFLGGLAAARTVRSGVETNEYVDSYSQPQSAGYQSQSVGYR
ncbi:MAG TPA: hypothetical protein VGZ02_04960 [Candidatus Baltobacteraceae bacterium]|jgi:hypothetical protein|nr:hypothetical protein [Candidatus Baltobacteraceae bacterium]